MRWSPRGIKVSVLALLHFHIYILGAKGLQATPNTPNFLNGAVFFIQLSKCSDDLQLDINGLIINLEHLVYACPV
ncbi:unnamed protein product [Allacma fusca]|uniref:Uncharacterized protein n=1 Tax=Allacma fusca TaxID=39272 RepID=A0A8J2NUW3_9HEXA|nr:unnamed protein product [Allacma fusca]